MPGNPKDCRLHAMRCAELAAQTKTPELKASLLELSVNWAKLAGDLEATNALLAPAVPDPAQLAGLSSEPRSDRRAGVS